MAPKIKLYFRARWKRVGTIKRMMQIIYATVVLKTLRIAGP